MPPLFPTGVVAREVCGSGAAAAVCGQLQRHELHQPRLWPEDVASDGGSIVQARLALLVAVVGGGVEWRHAVAVVRVVLAVGPDAERVLGGAIHFRAVLARQLLEKKRAEPAATVAHLLSTSWFTTPTVRSPGLAASLIDPGTTHTSLAPK